MKPEIEIIEIHNQNELPSGVEMQLYEPPYFGRYTSDLEEIVATYRNKYDVKPETIYKWKHHMFVLLPESYEKLKKRKVNNLKII